MAKAATRTRAERHSRRNLLVVSIGALVLGGILTVISAAPAGEPAPVISEDISRAIAKVFPHWYASTSSRKWALKAGCGSSGNPAAAPSSAAKATILTNHHVAGRGTRFVCTLSNREEVDATLIGTDALADLAVIKLDPASRRVQGEPLPTAAFGDSAKVKVGDVVFAMGAPSDCPNR